MDKKKLITPVISCFSLKRYIITKKLILQLLNIRDHIDKILIIIDYKSDLYYKFKNEFGNNDLIDIKLNLYGFGLSNARNTGIHYCESDLIAFLDDDALITMNWAKNVIKNFTDKNIVVVGGNVIPYWLIKKPKWASDEIDWIFSGLSYMKKEKMEVNSVRGANMIFRNKIFKKIGGGFKENLGRKKGSLLSGEENEICYRIKKYFKNKKIIYDPNIIVYHLVLPERATIFYLLKRAYYAGISIRKLLKITKNENIINLSNEISYFYYIFSNIIRKFFTIYSNFNKKSNEILGILTIVITVIMGFFSVSKI
jgi:glycosyltransferase involved in cell wall biosynthesis